MHGNPKGEFALELAAMGSGDLNLGLAGEIAGHGKQPRLALARGRLDENDRAGAVTGIGQRLFDDCELMLALDEQATEADIAAASS